MIYPFVFTKASYEKRVFVNETRVNCFLYSRTISIMQFPTKLRREKYVGAMASVEKWEKAHAVSSFRLSFFYPLSPTLPQSKGLIDIQRIISDRLNMIAWTPV